MRTISFSLILAAIASLTSAAPAAPTGKDVYVYGTNVNARECPHTGCKSIAQLSKQTVYAVCQTRGETVRAEGIENDWWSKVVVGASKTAFVTNIYIRGGHKIAGVPDC